MERNTADLSALGTVLRARTPNEPARLVTAHVASVLALLVVVLAIPLAFAGRADAFIYWTNPISGTIGRASNEGAFVDDFFIGGLTGPWTGLAVDTDHAYWTSPFSHSISRASLKGTDVDPNFVPADFPFGVAVDANHLYYSNPATPPSIGRANLDGTGVEPSFIPTPELDFPWGVAVDTDHVYWTHLSGESSSSIGRANLDGTGVDQDFITLPDNVATGIAVSANHIYWASNNTSTIGRANLDGSGVDVNFMPGNADAVAVDANHVYWSNCPGCVEGSTIGRANLDGSGVDQNFITGYSSAFALAVDSRTPADASSEVIVKGHTFSTKNRKAFDVKVTNTGNKAITVAPSDINAQVNVFFGAFGTVTALTEAPKALSAGAATRFGFEWAYSDLPANEFVTYQACVGIVDDVVRDNDCDRVNFVAK